MAIGLMEYLGSISSEGNVLDFTDASIERGYPPFPINNGLAQHIDTVMFAQEMNKRPWLSKHMQYQFLLRAIAKKKRYGKWAKKIELPEQSDIDAIKEFYTVSQVKAEEYLRVLSPEQLEKIKAGVFKGGSDGKVSKVTKAKK